MPNKFLSLVALFTLSFSMVVHADNSSPACRGTQVDVSLRGKYNSQSEGSFELGKNTITTGGVQFKAWSCEAQGMLILVKDLGDARFESRIVSTSAKVLLDFGEMKGQTIVDAFHLGLPAKIGSLSEMMASGLVTIYSK